jgi:hypothetical protein
MTNAGMIQSILLLRPKTEWIDLPETLREGYARRVLRVLDTYVRQTKRIPAPERKAAMQKMFEMLERRINFANQAEKEPSRRAEWERLQGYIWNIREEYNAGTYQIGRKSKRPTQNIIIEPRKRARRKTKTVIHKSAQPLPNATTIPTPDSMTPRFLPYSPLSPESREAIVQEWYRQRFGPAWLTRSRPDPDLALEFALEDIQRKSRGAKPIPVWRRMLTQYGRDLREETQAGRKAAAISAQNRKARMEKIREAAQYLPGDLKIWGKKQLGRWNMVRKFREYRQRKRKTAQVR